MVQHSSAVSQRTNKGLTTNDDILLALLSGNGNTHFRFFKAGYMELAVSQDQQTWFGTAWEIVLSLCGRKLGQ